MEAALIAVSAILLVALNLGAWYRWVLTRPEPLESDLEYLIHMVRGQLKAPASVLATYKQLLSDGEVHEDAIRAILPVLEGTLRDSSETLLVMEEVIRVAKAG